MRIAAAVLTTILATSAMGKDITIDNKTYDVAIEKSGSCVKADIIPKDRKPYRMLAISCETIEKFAILYREATADDLAKQEDGKQVPDLGCKYNTKGLLRDCTKEEIDTYFPLVKRLIEKAR